MSKAQLFVLGEVMERLSVDKHFIVSCIRSHWIEPACPESLSLDEEDITRLRLIHDLKEIFGVNEEAIPVILHLVDQIHTIHSLEKPSTD